MAIKFKKKNVTPTEEQLVEYRSQLGKSYTRNTNLRFGKIIILSDQDLDG